MYKNKINIYSGSKVKEVKSYEKYYGAGADTIDALSADYTAKDDGEEDDDFEYTAEVAGRELIQKPPRLDIPGLKPFEIMFVDEKDYDEIQRGEERHEVCASRHQVQSR